LRSCCTASRFPEGDHWKASVVARSRIAFFDLGQAEVENLYLTGGRQEYVSGLDVAVENAFSMGRIQRV
jgi:hypothetical protein